MKIHQVIDSIDPITTTEGATFTPWTDGYAVGFCVEAPGKQTKFIYLNPSSGDDTNDVNGTNVFVYIGPEGDINSDTEGPSHYYLIWDGP